MNQHERMMNWYNDSLLSYGEKDFRSLTWGTAEGNSAKARYDQMNSFHKFKDKNIIEFGCGWGSFFDFEFTCNDYYGIDINDNFISIAKKKYPEYNFENIDITKYQPITLFDIAISSGVAGNQGGPADHPYKLKDYLFKMYSCANIVMVNFPSIYATIRTHNIEYFSPASTLDTALSITQNVQLIHKEKSDFLLILTR